MNVDLSTLPDFSALSTLETESPVIAENQRRAAIRFVEAAGGPDFIYINGGDPATPGARQFEQTGGGVAVLDYDGDRWPDLFLPQGAEWKQGAIEPTLTKDSTDRLYRNVDGQRSIDVTRNAGLVDRGFGQGSAAADFDNDGFTDLYVANVGRNQLYHNNGDGTFIDVTEHAGLLSTDWTTSCVIVDLNADGHPDIFDVNYLEGPGVLERICNGKACSPSAFAGAPDRLYLSRGDGTFELVAPDRPEVDGKGLGVIAANLESRNRLSLFIDNDQVPNFLLRNRPAKNRHNLSLEEEGFLAGVSFNQDGLAMASMGIAADDADGDGRLDFYVTTFKDEASMLFLQDTQGLFVDATSSAGLRAATWPLVGWGTQFLDADLDGYPDLVMVNGHVDDYRDRGGEYHMRPQFFRNTGAAHFEELSASEIGPFFRQKRLGRGMARLDWNRDGRMDFAVSHIAERASLILNETVNAGNSFGVRLSARKCARDAIGSVIEVTAGDRQWSKQLTAGDGYMASNERLVQFGLGDATTVIELRVLWPSGNKTTVRRLPANRILDLIESTPRGILWNGSTSVDFTDATCDDID